MLVSNWKIVSKNYTFAQGKFINLKQFDQLKCFVLFSFVHLVENTMSVTYLFQFGVSGIILCISAFQISMVNSHTFSVSISIKVNMKWHATIEFPDKLVPTGYIGFHHSLFRLYVHPNLCAMLFWNNFAVQKLKTYWSSIPLQLGWTGHIFQEITFDLCSRNITISKDLCWRIIWTEPNDISLGNYVQHYSWCQQ